MMNDLNLAEKNMTNSRGFSLVEALVAIGIMGIVALAMSSMFSSIINENKNLSERLESIELEQSINRLTIDNGVCSCMFDAPAWTTGQAEINLNYLKKGCSSDNILTVGSPISASSKLKIESIKIKNISPLGANNVSGDVEIKLQGLSRAAKPITIAGLSFAPDSVSTPSKLANCLGIVGAQQLCTGMGGTWDGKCSLPPAEGASPMDIASTCKALGGTFTDPLGPCSFASPPTGPTSGTLVAHCESYQKGSVPGGSWPSYCFDDFSWCQGTGASFPNNCPSGSVLSNQSKKQRATCPPNSFITKFDCIAL